MAGLSFWQLLPMSIEEDIHNLVTSDELEDPGGSYANAILQNHGGDGFGPSDKH